MKNSTKIIVLWEIILFGLTFHSLLALMPLFFGANIAIPEATGTMPQRMDWMSLLFYLVPMICIVGVSYLSSNWVKITNLVIAALFILLNLFHFIEDWIVDKDAVQCILLAFILFCSVLLFITSLRWKKEK